MGPSMARFAAAVLFAFLFVSPAQAQQSCHPRETVVGYLQQEFQEEPVAMGIANNGGMIEVYTNDEQRTWTILITMPNGQTCMVAAGHGWESLPAILPSTSADPKA